MTKESLQLLSLTEDNAGISTGQTFWNGQGESIQSYSPVDGSLIGSTQSGTSADYDRIMVTAKKAFETWRNIPAPKRGEVVRTYGDALREKKDLLGQLVSFEMGKSLQEGLGEVQEMIDICDFAVGLSRQLYGLTIATERSQHRMFEQWHPLGVVGIISAFNFPVAVWSWNSAIALVCGNVVVWKPSEKAPLSAIACHQILADVLSEFDLPEGIASLIQGKSDIGEMMATDKSIALLSATGSTRMGISVATNVAKRLGKYLLELGGNNAVIISENSNMDIVLPAVVFGAVGTCGQRCTSTRRLIIHRDIYEDVKARIVQAYKQLRIGNPLDENSHVGPLIDQDSVNQFKSTQEAILNEGGNIILGGDVLSDMPSDLYVNPCIAEIRHDAKIVHHETFAPILYLHSYETLDEAVQIQNSVPQGLSSAIFSNNMQECESFLSASGSDCGIANVNLGTSGAEIGGAFGGEKETGGGRESGSDSWKAYMRRQTCTINYGSDLPLAQGIKFNL